MFPGDSPFRDHACFRGKRLSRRDYSVEKTVTSVSYRYVLSILPGNSIAPECSFGWA
jgi:hypothetical protein